MIEDRDRVDDSTSQKPAITLPGTVEKIIPPIVPSQPEKAQITVEGADDLYREIRVENSLTDPTGHEVKLKEGAPVEVTIEANREATIPKNSPVKESTPPNGPKKQNRSAG